MDALKSWAITVCFAALAAGIAGVIGPAGNMEKVYRFAISLFFLCCMLLPLFNMKKIDLNLQTASSSLQTVDMQKTLEEQTIRQAEINIENTVRNRCLKLGVTPQGVDVQLAASQDGSYDVSKVTIALGSKDISKEKELSSSLKNDLDLEVTFQEGEK